MSNESISKTGKAAIILATIAGILAIGRALYNYTQSGEWDIGKLALGIGLPCLIFVIVKATAPKR